MKADSPFNLLSPADVAKVADDACCYKANKHIPQQLTYLLLLRGMFISIAFVFILQRLQAPHLFHLVSLNSLENLFSLLGLMLVVVCGADLFTSTVLTIIPKATGRISWASEDVR